jgi:membrane fusion protein (multidrug efflux system)
MVVGDGKVKPRPVKVGGQQGGQWVVLDGLKAGEQVMVDGFQKMRARTHRSSPCRGRPGSNAGARARLGGQPCRAASVPASAASGSR